MKNYKDLKTFEDACKVEGLDPKKVIPDFSCYPEKYRESMIAHSKCVIIVGAANRLANDGDEWIPDFTNSDEKKYEPWFYLKEGSSGFRYDAFVGWHTSSDVGSHLSFKSPELAIYAGEQFVDVYRKFMIIE